MTEHDDEHDFDDFDEVDEHDELDEGVQGAAEDEETYLEDEGGGLWDGDRGNLDSKQRDTLVALLKKAFISSDDKGEWKTLTRDPGPIEVNLNNMYFTLTIDERAEVAFVSPARTADQPFRTLVRDAPNSREETLLLIYLRERFRGATASGEAYVFTDGVAMLEHVERFRPVSATDRVGDDKRVAKAIENLVTAGLLVKTPDESRFRVHRAIEALLPLSRLNLLLEAFKRPHGESAGTDVETYDGKHAATEDTRVEDEAEAAMAELVGRDGDREQSA